MYFVLVWQRFIGMCVFCVVVWQRVIGMVFVLCGFVAACHMYELCTLWWCVSVLYLWFVYCMVVWHRFIFMVSVLGGGLVACYM